MDNLTFFLILEVKYVTVVLNWYVYNSLDVQEDILYLLWNLSWLSLLQISMLYIFLKNKEEVLDMTVKGGSELCNEYLCWTLLQYCFYYMVVINDPFVEYIKNRFSRYSSFLWHGLCDYFPLKICFVKSTSIPLIR